MFGWFTHAVLELWAFERKRPRARQPRVSQRRLKQRLYWRDNGMCRYCGDKVSFEKATIDEVVPRVHGGQRRLQNCVLACWFCNQAKGPLLLEDPDDLTVDGLRARWASLDRVRQAERDPERLPR
jgi:5-methylcytosine-specific restriction endonuclease McrA